MRKATLLLAGLLSSFSVFATDVAFSTSKGDFVVRLNEEKAPISVENFLSYVNDGSYKDTIFHRVIPNFMAQGGGFTESLELIETRAPIKNESDNGLSNKRGTIAMARTQVVDSATRQFYINVVDNPFLDGKPGKAGYAVFGEVTEGMDVVDAIVSVPRGNQKRMADVPNEAVIIHSVTVIEE